MSVTSTLAAAPPRRSFNTGRLIVWGGFALLLVVAPLLFSSDFSITLLAQIGIAIVACLSYNMLLGQGGMLSFGHAVYTGLATFVAIHALRAAGDGSFAVPVSLIPLVGGLAGMFFAIILGYVTTKKAGTPFAMITLGIGELVFAMALMVPEFFGGEGGVNANRVVGKPVFGITFGPPIQVYYLLAFYTFVSTAAMFAFTRTPLGRMLNAVRDNPERVEFVGYNTQRVRYFSFVIAGFFAGIAGGMYALNFEIATAEVVGAARSGLYLLFTFLGGAIFFFGPIIGAVLMVLSFTLFSGLSEGWLLYLGLVFLFMVMYAPGGIASLIMLNLRVAMHRKLGRLVPWYIALALAALVMLVGAAALIEFFYHLKLGAGLDPTLRFAGLTLDTHSVAPWIGASVVALVGFAIFHVTRRRFVRVWGDVQSEIEAETAAKAAR
ncbi:branched-chain amino acid ABC transporter permease [Piscinibacter koreensis]|uniref:Branched-chain amino acid ABC transporter permease n=1 Tax=Piscinibacter koreensis TaxID=2742824 RepID=A0A7Y6NRX4_9BURK|nr:branched-chain amino acid ABC transporter permease [Schlegelella koreensis]NUZ08219.1 branched-chain amino acid ABC transporter permease [Schlegelella koreensis]